jgi:hypothetical protein
LYDLQSDQFEVRNLAEEPNYRTTLEQLRARLEKWMEETNDRGREPEPAKMYDSDMAVYLAGRTGAREEILKRNIELMKRWAAEGK